MDKIHHTIDDVNFAIKFEDDRMSLSRSAKHEIVMDAINVNHNRRRVWISVKPTKYHPGMCVSSDRTKSET